MDAGTAIRGRRSIRRFKPDPVPRKDIEAILEAAMMAPSARNARPWRFTVVTDAGVLGQLSRVTPYTGPLASAPCAIAVAAVTSLSDFWQQDCGAAIENMLLEATGRGYGSCWCGLRIGTEAVAHVKELLDITDAAPMALVAIGVSDESPLPRGRYERSLVRFID